MREEVDAKKSHLRNKREAVERAHILEKYNGYLRLKQKIELLTLAAFLNRLGECTTISSIPSLVLAILDKAPSHAIPSEAKIKTLLLATSQKVRVWLLRDFHAQFESLLRDSASIVDGPEDSPDDGEVCAGRDDSGVRGGGGGVLTQSRGSRQWSQFLLAAREWLLAFALVSLLPYGLTESKTACLEKYQEVLDEALTPLWGRFQFQLAAARETRSTSQLLWTFG